MKRPELSEFTDEELLHELEMRKKSHQGLVMSHVDALLSLVPVHDRTSCSDENPCNCHVMAGTIRCNRCQLLHVKHSKERRMSAETSVKIETYLDKEK